MSWSCDARCSLPFLRRGPNKHSSDHDTTRPATLCHRSKNGPQMVGPGLRESVPALNCGAAPTHSSASPGHNPDETL